MKNKRVLLAGCGDIGIALGVRLHSVGAQVWGLRRNPGVLPAAIQALQGDVTQLDSLNNISHLQFDYVVVTLTPGDFSDEGYYRAYVQGFTNILLLLQQQQFTGHLLFVSSTSVYHQHDGQWVDEDSPTLPVAFSGRRMLQAEQLLDAYPMAATIVRFAGIYGPGRRHLIEQVLALKGVTERPVVYTNRIHRDDCVGFLFYLLNQHYHGEKLDKVYVGVDSAPATLWSVKKWLAVQLGIDPESMNCLEPKRSSNKRCSNRRMLACGYQLLYPDYQRGYKELVKNEI